MHVAVAQEALRPPLCDHGRTVCMICRLDAAIVPAGTDPLDRFVGRHNARVEPVMHVSV